MARAQLGAGQYDEAIALFQRASELDPHDEGHVRRLVTALEHVGRSEDSIEWLSAFVDRNPCSEMRSTLSQLLHKQERYREEFTLLADGVAACPDSGRNLNDYAWALATSPNESLRDGALALEIATRAIENTDGEALPNYLDSLAAAYAEIGDFDAAVREEKRAIEILKRERAAHSIVFAYLRRLAELEARLPIRN
jgi:tetratricopeptide (TPR) repeat protein